MKYYETIIVGAGPAGSSCAWQLKRHNHEVLLLDRQPFPRLKLCAGWVPQSSMDTLNFTAEDYPHSILKLQYHMYIAPMPFPLFGSWALPWRTDYSIRRIEFDHWLLQRSNAPFEVHSVKKIRKQGETYIIDDQYQCKYLVGAGGTACPVRRTFFPQQRTRTLQISTLEKEFEYPQRTEMSHLFFAFHGLKGYAWYVPKGNGFLNIGIGGLSEYFSASKTSIYNHFKWFLADLVNRNLLDQQTSDSLAASGHGYYLFTQQQKVKESNCLLIGDSAGLASLDLGEGIGPAIDSGVFAANDILGLREYRRPSVSRFSLEPPLQWLFYHISGLKPSEAELVRTLS